MEAIETILEELLKKCNCFNEDEIQKKMKSWPGRYSRRNALYNIGLSKKCFKEKEINIFESWIVFKGYFCDFSAFKKFIKKLSTQDREKFLELSHFYYCWCKDPGLYEILDESFKLIVITSIIEALMSDYNFKEFYDWFCSDCSGDIIDEAEKINDLKKRIKFLWDKYKEVHGAVRKVKNFFDFCIERDDKERLIGGFKRLDKKPTNFNQIVGFLYRMRSDFVHDAKVVMLADKGGVLGHVIDGKPLSIKISIEDILTIFEKGFLKYFRKKHNA